MISETLTFVILGVSIYSIIDLMFKYYLLMLISVAIVFIARYMSIYPSCILANLNRKSKISRKMMFILSYAGPRGSMSFALAIQGLEQIIDEKQSILIVGMTTSYIIFSIFIVGGSLGPICKAMHLSNSKKEVFDIMSPRSLSSIYYLLLLLYSTWRRRRRRGRCRTENRRRNS